MTKTARKLYLSGRDILKSPLWGLVIKPPPQKAIIRARQIIIFFFHNALIPSNLALLLHTPPPKYHLMITARQIVDAVTTNSLVAIHLELRSSPSVIQKTQLTLIVIGFAPYKNSHTLDSNRKKFHFMIKLEIIRFFPFLLLS